MSDGKAAIGIGPSLLVVLVVGCFTAAYAQGVNAQGEALEFAGHIRDMDILAVAVDEGPGTSVPKIVVPSDRVKILIDSAGTFMDAGRGKRIDVVGMKLRTVEYPDKQFILSQPPQMGSVTTASAHRVERIRVYIPGRTSYYLIPLLEVGATVTLRCEKIEDSTNYKVISILPEGGKGSKIDYWETVVKLWSERIKNEEEDDSLGKLIRAAIGEGIQREKR